MRSDEYVRIEPVQTAPSRDCFRKFVQSIRLFIQPLTLQIRQVNVIAVDEDQAADAGASERFRLIAPQGTATDDCDRSSADTLLSLFSDRGKQHLPRITIGKGRRHTTILTAITGLLIAAAALPVCTAAAPEPAITEALRYENQVVREIDFEPAAQPVPVEELRQRLPITAGSKFHEHDLRAAIQALYATGRFAQIAVDAAAVPGGGVALKFVTTSAYFVGHVSIKGVDAPPNRGQLYGVTRLQLGARLTESSVSEAADSIKSLLRENGYYLSAVNTSVSFNPQNQQASIAFNLRARKRAHFTKPDIASDKEFSEEKLVRVARWRRLYGLLGWSQFTDARLRQGIDNIRRLYEKHQHLEARVALTTLDYFEQNNAVRANVKIDPGQRVAVRTAGRDFSQSELRDLLPIFEEDSIDPDLLAGGARRIEDYLQLQGFFGAEASYKVQHDERANKTSITYEIHPGPRGRLAFLGIRGNRYFDDATIRERLYEHEADFPRFPRGRFSLNYVHEDAEAIRQLYIDNGFLDVQVKSRLEENFAGRAHNVASFFDIHEGQQTIVASFDLEGADPAQAEAIIPMLACVRGQPYSAANVSSDRDNILTYYFDSGYPDATFEYQFTKVPKSHAVDLKYRVIPGERKFVRSVIVSGLRSTRANLVLDRISVAAGKPLSLAEQTESQRRLYDLGIFARVNTALQNPDGDESAKNVLYDIDEARHYSVNLGAGAQIARIGGSVTSLDNPAGTTGFAPRVAAGVTRDNLLGLGQTLGVQTALSTIEQRAALTYFIPQFVSTPDFNLTSVLSFDNSNDIRTFTARRREASLQLGQRVSRAYTMEYRLVFRNVTLSNLKVDSLLVPLLSQPETVGESEVSLLEDKRDDPTDAHHGSYTTIDLAYAPGFLGSQTHFARGLFRNATYYQITRNFVFARNTQFGDIVRTGGRSSIPLAERLYSGGSTSIRAFPDFQAGPRDLVTGFPLGGDTLFINNLELRFPLFGENVGGVIFQDAGNIYSSIRDFSFRFRQENLQDFNYLVQDVGIGIRYRTPIGPIRVDLSLSPDAPRFFGLKGTLQEYLNGTAVSTVQKINAFQFHISLGQAF